VIIALLGTKDQLQAGSLIELATIGFFVVFTAITWWRKKRRIKGIRAK
jgi:hypothetical protein